MIDSILENINLLSAWDCNFSTSVVDDPSGETGCSTNGIDLLYSGAWDCNYSAGFSSQDGGDEHFGKQGR